MNRNKNHAANARQMTFARQQRLTAAMMSLEPRRLLAAFTINRDPGAAGPNNFLTIADAITAAANTSETDDTITVAADVFTEDVSINTPVTILGAQATHDARVARTGGESEIHGQFSIDSVGVTVDGFTFVNGSAGTSTPTVTAIHVTGATATIVNNIFTGANAGTAILADSTVVAATAGISTNAISGWATGIDAHMPGTVSIDQNLLDGNGVAIAVRGSATTATISANTIKNSTTTGIVIDLLTDPGASSVSIHDNTLDNAGVAQLRLDGGNDGEDTVTLHANTVKLGATGTYINATAPTPLAGRSDNTFSLSRTMAEDATDDIDLALIDGTNIATATATGAVATIATVGTTVMFTPPEDFNGTTGFNFSTTDGATGSVSVTVTPVNDPPTVFPIPSQSLQENQTVTIPLAFYFSDVDGDTLTYSLSGAPSFVSVVPGTGVVTIAPHTGDAGTYSFNASASDGQASVSRAISLSVIRAVNQAPTFTNLPGTATIAENALVPVYDVDATDADNDAITYSIVGGNDAGFFAINPTTGAVTLTQTLDAEVATAYTLTIRATDNGQPAPATADGALQVNVTDVNDVATSVSLSGPATAVQGESVTYTATASDGDIGASLALKWFVDGVPQAGQTSNTFTTSFNYISNHVIRVEASDRGARACRRRSRSRSAMRRRTFRVDVRLDRGRRRQLLPHHRTDHRPQSRRRRDDRPGVDRVGRWPISHHQFRHRSRLARRDPRRHAGEFLAHL